MSRLSLKSLLIILVLVLIPIILLIRINQSRTTASAAWYNDSWQYRIAVNIGNTGSALTNYQVPISIGTSSLIAAGKMKSDCSDIRLTDSTGKVLPYWFSACNTIANATQVWPTIPTIPTSGATIYMYYGNSSATAGKTKTGTQTFPGLSCKSIVDAGDATGIGNYWIDPTNGSPADMFQAYCDMTNDSGGWMLVTQSMINNEIGTSVITTKTDGVNNGLVVSNIINNPGSCSGINSYRVYFNDIIPWTKIKSDHEFTGGNSCWAIFGNSGSSAGTNLIEFATATDTIRNQVKMGGSNGDNYDGINTRCDNVTYNFWHANQGLGTTRSAQVILRRNSMASLAGLGTGTACVANGYGWKYSNIYIKETTMTTTATVGSTAAEEVGTAPLAYWKFDEGVGTSAFDSTPNRKNLTLSNISWLSEDLCITGKCAQFNGSNSIGTGTPFINLNQSGFSISGWMKMNSQPAFYSSMLASSNAGLVLYFTQTSATPHLQIYNGTSWIQSTCPIAANMNQWYHLAATYNATTFAASLYLNGTKCTTDVTITSGMNPAYTNTISIGSYAGNYHQGAIDEVKIYPYVRTPAQMLQEYNAGKSHASSSKGINTAMGNNAKNSEAFSNGLVSYFKFDESSGSPVDSSGGTKVATNVGTSNYTTALYGNGFRGGVGTTNQITNPNFEYNATGYTGVPNTISMSIWPGSGTGLVGQTNSTVYYGSNSVKVDNYDGTNQVFGVTNYNIPISIGVTYTYSCWVKANTTSAVIDTYKGTSGQWSSSYVSAGQLNTWTRLTTTFAATANGTTNPRFGIYQYGGGTSSTAIFDGCQFEQATAVTAYVDGSLDTGYSWTGTAHASTSYNVLSALNINDTDTMDIRTGSMSWTYWFKTNQSTQATMYRKSDGCNGNGFITGINISNIGQVYGQVSAGSCVGTTSVSVYSVGTSLNNNQWHQMTTVLDRSQRKLLLYIDGSLNTSSDASALGAADLNAAAGAQLYTYNVFAGAVDELRLYNRALTSGEVSQLYSYAPGPSAYLTFEEGTGTTIFDKSGNNYSAYWQGSGSHWAPGKYGGGANFDGATDFINFTTLPKPASMPFTMMFWAKPRTATPVGIFDSAANQVDVLRNYSSGNVEWWSGAPTVSLGLTANQWAHLAFIFNYVGGTQTITYYKNGIQQASTSAAGDGQFAWTTMRLGNINAGTAGWYSGALDEFKIYSYARTSKQIVEDMNAGHPSGGSPVASQVGYWKFDEGFGTITQNAGNGGVGLSGVFGTGSSAPTWSNDGKYGKAILFSTPQNVKVNAATAFNYGQGGFTYSAWVKANVLNAAYNMVMGQWLPYFDIYANRLHLSMNAGGGQQSVWGNTQTLTTGQWYHIAASYDTSGYMKVYLNGKLDGTAGPYLTMTNYGNNLYFGTWQVDGSYPFNGLIDDVKIYNYALTSAEIALDYNRGAAMQLGTLSKNTGNTAPSTASSQEYCLPGDATTCAPPIVRWDFEEGAGTTAYDSSGNNNHGVLTNSPTWSTGRIGTAINYDTNSEHINIGAAAFDSLTNATLEMWFRYAGAYDTNRLLFYRYKDGNNRQPIFVSFPAGYGNYLVFENLVGGVNRGVRSDATILPNTWYHATFICGANGMKMYLNGMQQSQTNATTDCFSAIAATTDNRLGWTSSTFLGKIDNVRLYNYIRSPAQIALDYNRGGPVGWWKFDDCQGNTAYDSSGVGNTGTITIGAGGTQTSVGTCGVGGTTAWGVGATGKYNASLNLDGNDDWASISDPGTNSVFDTTDSLTLSIWIKPTASATKEIIMKGTNNPGAASYEFYQSGLNVCLRLNNNNKTACTSSNPLSTTNWNHLVGVYDKAANMMKIYVNAVEKMNDNYATSLTANNSQIQIGAYSDGQYAFSGQIDDVRIYNYALTASQVVNLYNNNAVVRFAPGTGSP